MRFCATILIVLGLAAPAYMSDRRQGEYATESMANRKANLKRLQLLAELQERREWRRKQRIGKYNLMISRAIVSPERELLVQLGIHVVPRKYTDVLADYDIDCLLFRILHYR